MVEPNSPEAYDAIYSERPGKWISPARDKLAVDNVKEIFKGEPYTLLDIGCGNGHTIDSFHYMWPNVKYFGVDISPTAVRLARYACPYADIYCAKLGDMNPNEPIQRFGPFDVITIMGVAEHFQDIYGELTEIRKRLTKNGIVYLEIPNNMEREGRKLEGWYPSAMQAEWYFKRETWEFHIDAAGFSIVKSVVGPSTLYEFIWVLKDGTERVPD